MHKITELPAWERLFKRIIWKQLGDIKGKKILDFGSGEGITADHFAKDNEVVALEPFEDMLKNAWTDHEYTQIVGDVNELSEFADNTFDIVICHNVLEYIDDKKSILQELTRVLKVGGFISLAKHNRAGRVMQMAVLLDDMDKANDLLDGKDSTASKFGAIRYYEDADITKWVPDLKVEKIYGIRTFWDLQQNQEKHADEDWQKKQMQLDMRVSEVDAFRDIAFFHHLILNKKEIIESLDGRQILTTNIDKIHSTEMGIERIRKNLKLGDIDVIQWCKSKILDVDSNIERQGKNWYIRIDGNVITVNAKSYTIITAHKEKG